MIGRFYRAYASRTVIYTLTKVLRAFYFRE